MEKYEEVRDIGSGNFGVARLMRNRETRGLVAVKLIERGQRVGDLFPSSLFSLSPSVRALGLGWSRGGIGSVDVGLDVLCWMLIDQVALVFCADWRECGEGDHQPPIAAAPQHHPVHRGADGECDLVHCLLFSFFRFDWLFLFGWGILFMWVACVFVWFDGELG
jgi:hypothetical protein